MGCFILFFSLNLSLFSCYFIFTSDSLCGKAKKKQKWPSGQNAGKPGKKVIHIFQQRREKKWAKGRKAKKTQKFLLCIFFQWENRDHVIRKLTVFISKMFVLFFSLKVCFMIAFFEHKVRREFEGHVPSDDPLFIYKGSWEYISTGVFWFVSRSNGPLRSERKGGEIENKRK